MAEGLDEHDYYSLLGVEPDADDAALKAAFRKFALRYHPDRFAGAPPEKLERATAIYRRGSEAIEVLSDPRLRAVYDEGLAKGELRLTSDGRTKRADARQSRTGGGGVRRTGRQKLTPAPTITSPSARAFYAKAQELAKAGDVRGAWRAVQGALQHEPGNPILEAALARIERAIR